MAKKVYFYKTDLYKSLNNKLCDYADIKELLINIINENSAEDKDGQFRMLDLTKENDLHYVADIFQYQKNKLFMRISKQKPAGSFLHRNYTTNIPDAVLGNVDEEKEGIEIYTYALLDYDTGIMSIVNQQGAPTEKVISHIFSIYNDEYYVKFTPIPNADGIDRIYNATEPQITSVELEIPIPNNEALETWFGWDEKEILDVQGKGLKATMKLATVERGIITSDGESSRTLIDIIKNKKAEYSKAKIRAKANGVKTRDYNFFSENFSYPIDVPLHKELNGTKYYYKADELIDIYKEKLLTAYVENKRTLMIIADRMG